MRAQSCACVCVCARARIFIYNCACARKCTRVCVCWPLTLHQPIAAYLVEVPFDLYIAQTKPISCVHWSLLMRPMLPPSIFANHSFSCQEEWVLNHSLDARFYKETISNMPAGFPPFMVSFFDSRGAYLILSLCCCLDGQDHRVICVRRSQVKKKSEQRNKWRNNHL